MATDEALRARLGAAASTLSLATSQLQLELQALGYYDGPIDGRYSGTTADAVRAFQTRIGVPPTGLIDSTTLRQVFALGQQNPLHAAAARAGDDHADHRSRRPPPVDRPRRRPPPRHGPRHQRRQPPRRRLPETSTTTSTTDDDARAGAVDQRGHRDEEDVVEPTPDPGPTMYAVLVADPQFSTFLDLVRTAGFAGDLDQLVPAFTLLVPTNAAFDVMDAGNVGRVDGGRPTPARPAGLPRHRTERRRDPSRRLHHRPAAEHPRRRRSTSSPAVVPSPSTAPRSAPPTDAANGNVYPIDAVLVPPS